jgi:hypothetical protein
VKQLWLVVVIPIVLGLLTAEALELAPSLARRLVLRASRWWAGNDHDRAAVLSEEWAALINECPGKLTKLLRATAFAAAGAWRVQVRFTGRLFGRLGGLAKAWRGQTASAKLATIGGAAGTTAGFASLALGVAGGTWNMGSDSLTSPSTLLMLTALAASTVLTITTLRKTRSAKRAAVRMPQCVICEGPLDSPHGRITLDRGIGNGHRVTFACPRCGVVQTGFVTPSRSIGSGS